MRRAGDQGVVRLVLRRVSIRDFVILGAIGLSALSASKAYSVAKDGKGLATKIQDGRKASNGITCAIATAVSEAGRSTIATPPKRSNRFQKNLEVLGSPSLAARQAAARKAGDAYVATIGASLRRSLGPQLAGELINHDGTFACDRIARIGGLEPPADPSTKGK